MPAFGVPAQEPHPCAFRIRHDPQAAHAAHLATLRRVLIRTFPPNAPRAVVLLDVGRRDIQSFLVDEIEDARERIASFDIVGAVDVRPVLRALGVDAGDRRLADLGPPQKTKTLNKSGRSLKITEAMLIQGSCGIARPFGDGEKLETYLRDGRSMQLRRRLEADAKSLFSFYQYGRLHGAVRLRWGFLDEMIPAPWVHPDEVCLYGLKRQALEGGKMLEVVASSSPRRCSRGWMLRRVSGRRPRSGSRSSDAPRSDRPRSAASMRSPRTRNREWRRELIRGVR